MLRGFTVPSRRFGTIALGDHIGMMDIRCGKIIEITKHPNADSLFVEKVDVGGSSMTVVSGLVKWHTAEELLNAKVLVICNMKPSKLRGIDSEGMLLAAGLNRELPNEQVKALFAPSDAALGARMETPQFPFSSVLEILSSNKMKKLLAELKTDEKGHVVFRNHPMFVQDRPVISSLSNAQIS
eukprot:ANDGO_00238.mRNA.1 Methionine--tRNA ligase